MMNAKQLERHVRQHADTDQAARLAMETVNANNEALNSADPNAATSILARAFIAYGMIEMTSLWLADIFPQLPAPEAFKAVRALSQDLPPDIATSWINNETGERR